MSNTCFKMAIHTGFLTAFLVGTPLKAEEPSKIKFGIHGSFVNLNGDISKFVSQGLGLSVFAERECNQSFAVRLRLEHVTCAATEQFQVNEEFTEIIGGKEYLNNEKATKHTGIMGELLYKFNENDKGFYGLAGIGFYSTRASVNVRLDSEYEDRITNLESTKFSNNSSGIAFCAGLGYTFNNSINTEIKYTKLSNVEYFDVDDGDPYSKNAGWVQLSVGFRF